MLVKIRHPEKLIYPETDGKPMGENTIQFQWILTLFHGFENLFFTRPDVFVAADLFWYPVHGDPTTVLAPDLMIVLGRPKGHRRSYKQWEEANIAPQVVVEICSPSNTLREREDKREFYSTFGVEEYYEYDPDTENLEVCTRTGSQLEPVAIEDAFVSPRLGVRFEVSNREPLRIVRPDGRPFLTYAEIITAAEDQQQRIFEEQQRAEEERLRAEEEQQRAEKFAAKLRELGVDPHTV